MFSKLITASNLLRATSDDLPSQVNHVWTVMVLTAMGLVISLVQYVGDPIQCWCPAHMPEVHCNYTKALCWIKETYYVDFGESIPSVMSDRMENEINYYPWAPWILFFMAAMFKLPNILWTGFLPSSDLDLERFIEEADCCGEPSELATILRIWLYQSRHRRKKRFNNLKKALGALGLFWLGSHRQTYITGLVIFTKMCYLVVAVCMFFALNIFIDEDFTSYGFDTFLNFLNGVTYDSKRFPKHTVCDIRIRQMSNVNTYSIQCILPINLYNQKIFLFLWYWYVVLIIMNGYSYLHWAFNLLSSSRRCKLINDYIIIMDHVQRKKQLLEYAQRQARHGNDDSSLGTSSTSVQPSDDTVGNTDNSADTSSLLTVASNADGTRLRVGKHVNFMTDTNSFPSSRGKKGANRYLYLSPVEMDSEEFKERSERRRILQKTRWIYSKLDVDGVVVFRTLETAVGVVVSNDIFTELYRQMWDADHHDKT